MANDKIFIKQKNALVSVEVKDIIILESADNYCKFILMNTFYSVRMTLNAAVDMFPDNTFVRIHRRFAVAINAIQAVEKDVVKVGGIEFPMSRKYYHGVISQLKVFQAV